MVHWMCEKIVKMSVKMTVFELCRWLHYVANVFKLFIFMKLVYWESFLFLLSYILLLSFQVTTPDVGSCKSVLHCYSYCFTASVITCTLLLLLSLYSSCYYYYSTLTITTTASARIEQPLETGGSVQTRARCCRRNSWATDEGPE